MNFLQWFQKKETKSPSGSIAEQIAQKFLQTKNFKIITSNFSCKLGEIDIIATDQNKLVFVEVKYRKNKYGPRTIKAAVPKSKQKKIILTAKWYLKQKYHDANQLPACRFDVVTIEGNLESPDIEHYQNAFRADPKTF